MLRCNEKGQTSPLPAGIKGLVCAFYARGCWCWTEQIFWEWINFTVFCEFFFGLRNYTVLVEKFHMALLFKVMIKGQVCRRVCWTGKVWEFQSIQGIFSIFELVFYRTWHDSKLRIKGQVCRSWGVCSTERVWEFQSIQGAFSIFERVFFIWVIEHGTIIELVSVSFGL